jgi:hypothetical protein
MYLGQQQHKITRMKEYKYKPIMLLYGTCLLHDDFLRSLLIEPEYGSNNSLRNVS